MSQAKVEKRKEEKKNRDKLMRKEKASRVLVGFLGVVLVAAIGFWIGFSVYQNQKAATAGEPVTVNLSSLQDYESTIVG